jgi:hypothetical protein
MQKLAEKKAVWLDPGDKVTVVYSGPLLVQLHSGKTCYIVSRDYGSLFDKEVQ